MKLNNIIDDLEYYIITGLIDSCIKIRNNIVKRNEHFKPFVEMRHTDFDSYLLDVIGTPL